ALLEENREALPSVGSIARVAFSPDGTTLASLAGREIAIWNVTGRTLERRWDVGGDRHTQVTSLAFSPDGTRLAVDVAHTRGEAA
ncbi:WD40 repeat domain-containing protein, partial [Salmonella enterica]|uniref:WD40 repeat domain-containing protein n=1 Tax=Salmonella enterica TaxID=28901 RepID=UPI0032992E59